MAKIVTMGEIMLRLSTLIMRNLSRLTSLISTTAAARQM